MGFDGSRSRDILAGLGMERDIVVLRGESPGPAAEIGRLVNQMKTTFKNRSPGQAYEAQGLLLQIFARFAEFRGLETIEPNDENYTGAVKEFIRVNFQRDISVPTIARHVGLNPCYLSTLFLRLENQTLQDHLIRCRMSMAADLLRDTSLKIGDIAKSVGYPDYAVFAKRFHAVMGLSPSDYRCRV